MKEQFTAKAELHERLYRKEAIEFLARRAYGEIVIVKSISSQVVACSSVIIAAVLICMLFLLSYQRKIEVGGLVNHEAGVQRITSMQVGRIAEMLVKEGERVKAGQILVVVDSSLTSEQGGNNATEIAKLLQRKRTGLLEQLVTMDIQLKNRNNALLSRLGSLRTQSAQFERQITLQKRRVQISTEDQARSQSLLDLKYVSPAALSSKEADSLDQYERLGELERAKGQNERDITSALADMQDQATASAMSKSNLGREISLVDQEGVENETRRRMVIVAPDKGVVTAIGIHAGQSIAVGQNIMSVIPTDGNMIVELYVPSKAAGFIHSGMNVIIDFAAYPYQKFGHHSGHIVDAAIASNRPEDMTVPGASSLTQGESVYRVRVALNDQFILAYGERHPMKAGMAVVAHLILDERTLIEWMLEPLWTITGRV